MAKADLSLGSTARPESTLSAQGDRRSAALAHYAAARELENEGRMRAAYQHYREASKASPEDTDLASRTAELALTFEGYDAAVALLEESIKANPNSSDAPINLARFLVTYGSSDASAPGRIEKVLAEALIKFSNRPDVYREAIILQLTRNQRDEASRIMELAAKQSVSDPQYWLDTGRIAQEVWPLSDPDRRDDHRAKVNRFFENALKHSLPTDTTVRLAVAQFFLLSNQLDRASQISESLVKLTPSLEARRLMVRLYQVASQEDEAAALLEEILKMEPNDVESRRLLASIYERKEQYAKAVPHAEALIQTAGGTADDYAAVSFVLLRANEVEKLRKLSLRGMGLFPNDPRFPHLCAVACRVQKRMDDALQYYAKAETLAQSSNAALLDDRFYSSWADTLQAAEKFDQAAKMYQRAVDLIPPSDPARAATVLNNLGYMWLEQGKNLDKAGEFITKATELDPKNPVYLDSLGWFHFLKGEYPKALKVLLDVEALLPKMDKGDAEILDHIAQTYVKLGEKAKALDYFERALKLDPEDAKIRQRMEEAKK